MKSYKILLWYNCKLGAAVIDLNNQLSNYLKNNKRVIHKFKRSNCFNCPSSDQWRLEIMDNNCIIRIKINEIKEVKEIQVINNQGKRVFTFGESQIIYTFSMDNDSSSSVRFNKGIYTLLPIFSLYNRFVYIC